MNYLSFFVSYMPCLLSFVICVCMLCYFWYGPLGWWQSALINKKWWWWWWRRRLLLLLLLSLLLSSSLLLLLLLLLLQRNCKTPCVWFLCQAGALTFFKPIYFAWFQEQLSFAIPPLSFTTMWLALEDADLHFSLILVLLRADTHASNDHCEENVRARSDLAVYSEHSCLSALCCVVISVHFQQHPSMHPSKLGKPEMRGM